MTDQANIHVQRADHVGFAVASLDEAVRFWVEGLGARLVRTGEMGGAFLGQVTGAHGRRSAWQSSRWPIRRSNS
nr:VOC family protein [Bosea sp. 124]